MTERYDYVGIDYGYGKTNIDNETGIRFGVISANEVTYCWDSFDPVYPIVCPHCENEIPDDWDETKPQENAIRDALDKRIILDDEIDDIDNPICPQCFREIDDRAMEWFNDCGECSHWECSDPDYGAFIDSTNDIIVTKSPYYSLSQLCSPCFPGGGSLSSPCDNGYKAYCLGHDWFEGGIAPYDVYSVETGKLIPPPTK